MFVESIHLPDSVTKRKPDVVLVGIESGEKWLGVEASGTSVTRDNLKERIGLDHVVVGADVTTAEFCHKCHGHSSLFSKSCRSLEQRTRT